MTTTIYTDGACRKNPGGPGGWGWAVAPDGVPCASGRDPSTTNQRMELTAALEALRHVGGDVEIVSDSKYLVDCFQQRWHTKWVRNGWKNSKGEPVANADLWEALLAAVAGRTVTFRWVRGHNGDPMNELADRLATAAI